jgi:hypothetical protein
MQKEVFDEVQSMIAKGASTHGLEEYRQTNERRGHQRILQRAAQADLGK